MPAADAAAVNSDCTKILLANTVSTFLTKCKPAFDNGARTPPRNPRHCTILDN